MDAYRVIRHSGDEDEVARWACRARQQRGLVEIASEPPPAVPRSCVFGGLDFPRRPGEESSFSSPGCFG